ANPYFVILLTFCFFVVPPSIGGADVPPNIAGSEMPSEVSVLLGESIQLVCDSNGVPAPVMHWLKDGKRVASDELQRIRQAKIMQTLQSLLIGDTGKYTCVASNDAGDISKHFSLKVLGKC
uniref:Ig-like domain-containing protein n=1 Tax=Apteryx owenii TaxID=8824 RepID=A0A8B9QFB3_APTOW